MLFFHVISFFPQIAIDFHGSLHFAHGLVGMQSASIGCLNVHGTHVAANYSTNNNVVLFFCFRFENSIL